MNMGKALLGAFAAMGSATMAVPAMAQTTVGAGNSNNALPFEPASFGVTRYQEVYNAAAFSQPITFDTISFGKANAATTYAAATYQISFSQTSFSSVTLTDDLNANVTGNQSAFGTFNVSGPAGSVLSFTGNAFTFNPASGTNLLMDIRITNAVRNTGPLTSFRADGTQTNIARAFTSGGSSSVSSSALQTTFSLTAAAPEPGSWALMILGFGMVGYALRRRHVSFRPGQLRSA